MTQPSDRDAQQAGEKTPAEDVPSPASGIAAGFEVRVQHAPIDVAAEVSPIMRNPNVGAVVDFIGIARNSGDGDDIVALELEHYPGMTEHSLWGIAEEAAARWSLDAVKVVHRIGRIALGLPVVIVVVASPHRAAAFEACEFIMDFLKTHAPFWKKEISRDGESHWVEAKSHDEQAMLRWG